jgi:hypothetical protein
MQAPSSDRFLFGLSAAAAAGGGGPDVVVTSSNSSLVGQEGAEITAYDINQFAAEGGASRQELDTPQTTSAEQQPEGEYGYGSYLWAISETNKRR